MQWIDVGPGEIANAVSGIVADAAENLWAWRMFYPVRKLTYLLATVWIGPAISCYFLIWKTSPVLEQAIL